jgi:hypothetical protein
MVKQKHRPLTGECEWDARLDWSIEVDLAAKISQKNPEEAAFSKKRSRL